MFHPSGRDTCVPPFHASRVVALRRWVAELKPPTRGD